MPLSEELQKVLTEVVETWPDRFANPCGEVRSLAAGTLKIPGVYVGMIVEDSTPPPQPPVRDQPYIFRREKLPVRVRYQTPRDIGACPNATDGEHYWRGYGRDSYSGLPRQRCKFCSTTRLDPKEKK